MWKFYEIYILLSLSEVPDHIHVCFLTYQLQLLLPSKARLEALGHIQQQQRLESPKYLLFGLLQSMFADP